MRLTLIGGSYTARGLIANAQRCINLFPEENQKDSPVPFTHYQRPGFTPLVTGAEALPVRGLYRASNGAGYCVIGQKVYKLESDFSLTELGTLAINLTTPVSMIDNGTTLMLVDNSPFGYTITLATDVFAQIVDGSGTFTGATKVDFIDTFIIWNIPGTNRWGSTLSNSITFDSLYIASKNNYPEPLQTLAVCRREIFLLGALKSEIWFDAGDAQFPFAELPGAAIEHGTVAPFSVAQQDLNVYMLGQNLQGSGVVFRLRGYECVRISTHAIEYAIQQYPTINDAIGYCYQQDGHAYYVLCFPSADATWVFDEATQLWHQRAWTDSNGVLHRDRSNCCAFIYGKNLVGDWQNGTIYELDRNAYQDTVAGQTYPLTCIRGFPHLQAVPGPQGPMALDGKRVQFHKLVADLETGNTPLDADGNSPQITLRYSDDRGRTFGPAVLQAAGSLGQFNTYPQWLNLGIARDRVFELQYSFNGKAPLNGAWVEAKVLES